MRTVAAVYSGLANFGTYAGAATANATYAALAVDTVYDGSASGASIATGSSAILRVSRVTASGTATSGGNTSGGSRVRASASSGVRNPADYARIQLDFATYATAAAAKQTYADLQYFVTYPITTSGTAIPGLVERTTGSGSSSSAGAADQRQVGRDTATGASASAGTSAVRRVIRDTATGALTSTGSADQRQVLRGTANVEWTYGYVAGLYGTYADMASANATYKALLHGDISQGSANIRALRRVSAAALSHAAGQAAQRQLVRALAHGDSTSTGEVHERLLITAGWGIFL